MRDNQERGELDPAEGICWGCKKNYPSLLSCIGNRKKEGCDRGSEVGTVYKGKTGKDQFLRETKGIWAVEGVVRKSLSSRRVAGVPNLCNDRGQGLGKKGVGRKNFRGGGKRKNKAEK